VSPLGDGDEILVTDPILDVPDGCTFYDDERDQWLTRIGERIRLATGTEVEVERGAWRGVYPSHCINPETCRGYSHCPRNYSCVE
jgi:hypothetical protein